MICFGVLCQICSCAMWKFCLNRISPLPFLLLLLTYSFLVSSQQIPFSSSLNLNNNNKYFTLKQVLHHGGISNSRKSLFRKLEIKQNQNFDFEDFSYTGNGPSGEYIVNFREETRASGFGINNIGKKIPIPDHQSAESILSLAKMSYNAYIRITNPGGWLDLEDLDYEKLPFGWEETGLRGYVFSDHDNSTVIIAFKGTSLKYVYDDDDTASNDKYHDNLMFSCCCAQIDFSWRGICDCKRGGRTERKCDGYCVIRESNKTDSYFETSLKIYDRVKKDYPDSTIWLTGHSLGGSIASLVALKHNLPAIVFQTPGEKLYARRIGLDVENSASNIYHFGHTADPIFTGECNGVSSCYVFGFAMETRCHLGKSCVYDTRLRLGWKSDIRNHALLLFIDQVIKEWPTITEGMEDVASCQSETQCEDCGHWEIE